MNFDSEGFIDIFVGKNGSGKSNFFEALIEIFRHLAEFDKSTDTESEVFEYRITYAIDGSDTTIEWKDSKLQINGDNDRKTLGKTPFPDNVLIYYSGHNPTVAGLVDRYERAFRSRIRVASADESRRFIGVGPRYKSLLLSVLLAQPTTNKARAFVGQKLGIQRLGIRKPGTREVTEAVMKVMLRRPIYAQNNKAFDIANNDASDRYWKVKGITREFLDRLTNCIRQAPGNLTLAEGYLPEEDSYTLYLDIENLQEQFKEAQDLFHQFDNLLTLGMLADISIPFELENGVDADVGYFSDGQFQSIYIYTIIELFKDRNCITFLDEPDAFLHPQWQFEFLKQVAEITDKASKKNHVLMSTHSAATLCNWEQQSINLLQIEDSLVSHCKKSKKNVIHELSDSFIQYSEDESKLLIDNVIRTSNKPILFVEGPCDVSILNTAYRKLYPNAEVDLLFQDAFDRGFIRTLFARQEIFATYPQKELFALFDFDDAYEDWRSLGGEHQVNDISLGLCRKLTNKNAYTFLLPIPNNRLRAQVWDEGNAVEKIKPNPHFCMEHVFWEVVGLEKWFRTDPETGRIYFKGDKHKVRFAREIVPSLSPKCFEPFRSMFEFIKARNKAQMPA
jgi:energy-coupling factor transporter ATP-binding protein EcfA2